MRASARAPVYEADRGGHQHGRLGSVEPLVTLLHCPPDGVHHRWRPPNEYPPWCIDVSRPTVGQALLAAESEAKTKLLGHGDEPGT